MFVVQKQLLGVLMALLLIMAVNAGMDTNKATLRGSSSNTGGPGSESIRTDELVTISDTTGGSETVVHVRKLQDYNFNTVGAVVYNFTVNAILTWPMDFQLNNGTSMDEISDVVRMTEIFYRRITAQQYPRSYQMVACSIPTTAAVDAGDADAVPLVREIEFSVELTFRTTTTGVAPTPQEAFATITNIDQDDYLDSFVRMGTPKELFQAVESVQISTSAPQLPSAVPSLAPTAAPSVSSAPTTSSMPTTSPSSEPSLRTEDEEDDQIIPVIAVVDSAGPSREAMNESWDSFRLNWPNRPFCVLRLFGSGDLMIPSDMASDSNVIIWNVDRYDDTNKNDIPQSEWFDICQVGSSQVSSVALLVQVSEEAADVIASKKNIKKLLEGGDSSDDDMYTIMVTPRDDGNWIEPFDVMFLATASPTDAPTS